MPEYVARFEMSEITGQTEEERKKEIESNAEKSVDKKGIDTKTIGKALTLGVAAITIGSQIYQRSQSAMNSIRGDSIEQNHLNNQMAYLNEGLRIFGSLGIAAIVNPALVPVAAVGLAVSYGMKAYSTALENRVKQAGWQIDALNNAEKQKRLVQNITSNRI